MKKPFKKLTVATVGLGLAMIFASAAREGYVDYKIKTADTVGRAMTQGEIKMARGIFGDATDYSRIRLHNAPAEGDDAKTFGNDIYLEDNELHGADLSEADVGVEAKKILIHELTHVWRFQTSTPAQRFLASARMKPYSLINNLFGTHLGYDYSLKDKFIDGTEEQKATTVGDYFVATQKFDADGCDKPGAADVPVCQDVRAGVLQFEQELKPALPLPGARVLKPVPTLAPPVPHNP
jgi:hypothetical protein